MSKEEILLTSPSGYYGEEILQAFYKPTTLPLGTCPPFKPNFNPRSHFEGISLSIDESSLELHATVLPPAIDRPIMILISNISKTRVITKRMRTRTTTSLEVESSKLELNEIEESPETKLLIDRLQNQIKQEKAIHNARQRVLAANFHAYSTDTSAQNLPEIDDTKFIETIENVVWRCASKFPDIGMEDIDQTINEIADELIQSDFLQYILEGNREIDINAVAIRSIWHLIDFISELSKYLWYIGMNDWSTAIQRLDGRYPQTKQPSILWTESLQNEFIAKQYFTLEKDDIGILEHAARLARAYKWPVIQREMGRLNIEQFTAMRESFENNPFFDAMKKMALYDAYFAEDCPPYREPVLLNWRDISACVEGESSNGLEDGSIHDEILSACLLLDDWFTRIRHFIDFFSGKDWIIKHNQAFPMQGSNLGVSELIQQDCLGFGLREIETEVEGNNAWKRHVYHSIFTDSYGPVAIADRITKKLDDSRRVANAKTTDDAVFMKISNLCQSQLNQFVKLALTTWFANDWQHHLPNKLLENARKRQRNLSSLSEILEEAYILNYKEILVKDAIWKYFRPFLEGVGMEKPSKTKLQKFFSSWNNNRNAVFHPEKSSKFEKSCIFELEEFSTWIERWTIRLVLESTK